MKLQGMKAIANHVGMSEDTILRWIETRGFPAARIGGLYLAETDDIVAWQLRQQAINSPVGRVLESLTARIEVLEAAAKKRPARRDPA
ncbi:MAG: helix-turn-helix domain-containing protein [Acidobacteriales bacterium]|nr:helix-turn-helix domain-containing protein [Terriglobales bacterium]